MKEWFESGIESLIGFVSTGIDMLDFWTRWSLSYDLYSCFTGLLHSRVDAGADAREQSSAESRSLLSIRSNQLHTKYIGDDLTPKGAFRTAPGSAYLFNWQALFTDDVEAVFEAEGDSFQDSTDEMASIMAGGEAEPAAACIGIEVRGAFALQVGQEEKAIAAWRYRLRFSSEDVIGVQAGPAFQGAFRQAYIVAQPAQGETCPLCDAHQIPGIGNGMIEGMHSRHSGRVVDAVSSSIGQNNAAGTDGDEGQAGPYNAITNSSAGIIGSPACHGRTRRQTCKLRYFCGDGT